MNAIIVLLIIDTVLQILVCKFSLWWLLSVLCRLLFCCRIIGATFAVKKLAIGEAVIFCSMLLFNVLFSGDGMPWLKLFSYLAFSGIAIILEYLDDILYVYVIEDDNDN